MSIVILGKSFKSNINFDIETNGFFIARFRLKKVGERVTERVTENQKEILKYVLQNKFILEVFNK